MICFKCQKEIEPQYLDYSSFNHQTQTQELTILVTLSHRECGWWGGRMRYDYELVGKEGRIYDGSDLSPGFYLNKY